MEKNTETDWDADDSAPIASKGRKNADYRNQTTNASSGRFPWATLIAIAVLVAIVGLILLM